MSPIICSSIFWISGEVYVALGGPCSKCSWTTGSCLATTCNISRKFPLFSEPMDSSCPRNAISRRLQKRINTLEIVPVSEDLLFSCRVQTIGNRCPMLFIYSKVMPGLYCLSMCVTTSVAWENAIFASGMLPVLKTVFCEGNFSSTTAHTKVPTREAKCCMSLC